jgi:hypothetical protein
MRDARLVDAARNFLVSYTAKDQQWAASVAFQLEEASYTTLIQAWTSRPVGISSTLMDQAKTTSAHTIGMLSPEYLSRAFPRMEMAAALAGDPLGHARAFIPVRVENFVVPGLLAAVNSPPRSSLIRRVAQGLASTAR